MKRYRRILAYLYRHGKSDVAVLRARFPSADAYLEELSDAYLVHSTYNSKKQTTFHGLTPQGYLTVQNHRLSVLAVICAAASALSALGSLALALF